MSNYSGGGAVAGWYPDPYQRHQVRYWNGTAWTEHVSDNGVQSVESAAAPAPVATYQAQPAQPTYQAPQAYQASQPYQQTPGYGVPYGTPPSAQRAKGSPAVAILLIVAGAAGALASMMDYLTLNFGDTYGIGDSAATGWEVQKALGAGDKFSYSMTGAVILCAIVGVLGIVLLVNGASAGSGVPVTAAVFGAVAAIFTVLSYTLTDSLLNDMGDYGDSYSLDVTLSVAAGFLLQLAAAVTIVVGGIIGAVKANSRPTV